MSIKLLIKTDGVLPSGNNVLGYHGTSVEAVLELNSTGRLPNQGLKPGRFSMVHPHEGIDNVIWYATQIAVRHSLLHSLPFKVQNHHHILAAQSQVDPKLRAFGMGYYERYLREFMEFAKAYGIETNDILETIRNGYRERRGCILTISKEMEEHFEKTFDDNGKMEFSTPDGVGVKYILAIHPLGNFEHSELEEKLQLVEV